MDRELPDAQFEQPKLAEVKGPRPCERTGRDTKYAAVDTGSGEQSLRIRKL